MAFGISSIENFFGGLANGAENLLGLNKKKQQDQSQPNAPQQTQAPQQQQQSLSVNSQPDVSQPGQLNVISPTQLEKATPEKEDSLSTAPSAKPQLTPQQQASQRFIDANGGPVNPNYKSPSTGFGADLVNFAKGLVPTPHNIKSDVGAASNFLGDVALNDTPQVSSDNVNPATYKSPSTGFGATAAQFGRGVLHDLLSPVTQIDQAAVDASQPGQSGAQQALDFTKAATVGVQPLIGLGGETAAQITGKPQATAQGNIESFTKSPFLTTAGNVLGTAGILAGLRGEPGVPETAPEVTAEPAATPPRPLPTGAQTGVPGAGEPLMPTDIPAFQRQTLALPAGPDLNRTAVPINPGTPAGDILLNQGKPQLSPTELVPATPPKTVGMLDANNVRLLANKSDVIPGEPAQPAPGRNLTDISAPAGSVNPATLEKAREAAITAATNGNPAVVKVGATEAPPTASTPLPELVKRVENPTGTDSELLQDLNAIITHPDAKAGVIDRALELRDQLLNSGNGRTATPAETPNPATLESAPGPANPLETQAPPVQAEPATPAPDTATPAATLEQPGTPTPGEIPSPTSSSLPASEPSPPPPGGSQQTPIAADQLQGQPKTSETPNVNSSEANVSQTPGNVNPDLKNARFQQAAVDNAKDPVFKQAFKEDAVTKDGVPQQQLVDEATAKVSKLSFPELVDQYGKEFDPKTDAISGPAQYYEYLQALTQLEQFPGDPAAASAAANALTAINDFANRMGSGLQATRVAYENMPATMKVAYAQNLVRKAGGDLSEADLNALNQKAVEQTALAKTAQEARVGVNEVAAKLGQDDPNFNENMGKALQAEADANKALYAKNAEVYDLISKNMPKSALGTRLSQNARIGMLSSAGGRAFALLTTGVNTVLDTADRTASAVVGKGVNAVRGDNAVRSSLPNPATLVRGGVEGISQHAKDTFGTKPVENLPSTFKKASEEYGSGNLRYGTVGSSKIPALGRKVVNFVVGSHVALTKGVRDSIIEQQAKEAVKTAGPDGTPVPENERAGFIEYYKAHPPTPVAEQAANEWMGVNNLHNNKISNSLNKMSSTLDDIAADAKSGGGRLAAGIAQQIRTAVLPFSRYMGGFLQKGLTDRNIFYNMYKIGTAKSPQELSDNLARLGNNVAIGSGVGYVLAKNGIITTKDQSGNSYDGMYFHIGDKYYSMGLAAQAAMPIMMGANAALTKDPVEWGGKTVEDLLKVTGVAGVFGSTPIQEILSGSNAATGAIKLAFQAAQQHIPAFLDDINAGLNRSPLNPTGHAAETKVSSVDAKGNTVTTTPDDVARSETLKTLDKIPGVSQMLPRSDTEEAKSEFDRMLHAGEASAQQILGGQQSAAAAKQAKSDLAAGVPVYDKNPDGTKTAGLPKGYTYANALESTIEKGQFDKAAAGLKNEQAYLEKQPNEPPSKIQDVKDKITQMGVAKSLSLKYQDLKDYNSTSLTAWRDMGNPKSASYNPDQYQKLWAIDQALAEQGVAGTFGIGSSTLKASDSQKFSAKAATSGSGSGSKSGGTLHAPTSLTKLSLTNLKGEKAPMTKVALTDVAPTELVKARTIGVKQHSLV